ncbi:MAG: HAMP domain-containing histidine kinase [Oligoflexia bacterium]|nr:HAMP domain-containing histidine kinase [Oligoflexia bacterium]
MKGKLVSQWTSFYLFIGFNVMLLLLFLSINTLTTHVIKKSQSEQIYLENRNNTLLGEHRALQTSLNLRVQQDFKKILILNEQNKEINSFSKDGNLVGEENFFLYNRISYDVFYDGNNSVLFGKIVFIYQRVTSFLNLMGIWFLLAIASIPLIQKITKILNDKTRKKLEQESKILVAESLTRMARQVSHDIRSPLAALNMTIKRCYNDMPEEERIIIRSQVQRIQDIANNLLSSNKKDGPIVAGKKISSHLLSSCIDELVTDKRLEFRQYLNLHINADLDNSYGLFAKINTTELKRVLSNLINNAREALTESSGIIVVKLYDRNEKILIIVEDNGKGIPVEIVKKLGEEGVSFGKEGNKESGSGIGLFAARKTVEELGGRLAIESVVGIGTKIVLELPKELPPHWFVSELHIKKGMAIVILDDDQGIHQTWDSRFQQIDLEKIAVKIFHLSTPNSLDEWMKEKRGSFENVIYLFDYELLGHKKTGLDLIEEYQLGNKAVLVTSHYEEEKIRERCKKLNVKIIPKMIVGHVPLEIVKEEEKMEHVASYAFVYIEDDDILRRGWTREARKAGVNLLTLANPQEFDKYENALSKENCEIYIDRELGDEWPKGEEVAVKLYEKGFRKIFLATGHSPDMFKHIPWLVCKGKESPWEQDDW